MRPLLLVNWRHVNTLFCALMWAVALVLALVVLMHAARHSATLPVAHAPVRTGLPAQASAR